MRTTILRVTCDRCDMPIAGEVFQSMIIGKMNTEDVDSWQEDPEQIDLCPECAAFVLSIATNGELPQEPKRTNKRIDYGKADALKKAGWTNKAIAEELKCSEWSICQHFKKEA